jgi:hypothetical protein
MNRHFVEMLSELSAASAEFLVIGAHAVFLTSPTGLNFDEAWASRVSIAIEGREFPFLSKADLIRAKRATARPQDLVDADMLERG